MMEEVIKAYYRKMTDILLLHCRYVEINLSRKMS